jgi:hypothetical protein
MKEEWTKPAIQGMAEAARAGSRLVVIPGGGPTDKTIEALDKRHPFAPNTHHRACARAQDQTGLMISDPAFGTDLVPCENLEQVTAALDEGKVAVLLPSSIIFAIDPFERTWEITSDGMSAWFAWLLGTKQLVILTDVDGVYPPQSVFEGPPIPKIAASQLDLWGHTAVDACTPSFLKRHGISCWVLHGGKPGRLASALGGQKTVGTLILPE